MSKRITLFIIIIFMLLFVGGCSNEISQTKAAAQNGLLDLSQIDFENEVVDLDGKWEFFWNQLLEPGELDQSSTGSFETFPSSWTKYSTTETTISGNGYATYRLNFINADNKILALKIPKVRTAYKLWVNGNLIVAAGKLGTTRDDMVPQYLPQVVFFDAQQGQNELIMQVSNYYRPSGGLLYSISLGNPTQILNIRYHGIAYELFLFGALMMMGIYHLALFFFRSKDRTPLYFGLFCMLVAVRTMLIGEAFFYVLFPYADFEIIYKIQSLTYYLGVPLILMFFKAVLPEYFHTRIVRATQLFAAIYLLVVLLTPPWVYSAINPLYQIWSLLMILYLFAMLMRIAHHRIKDSWLIIFGGLALIVTCVIDIVTLSSLSTDNWPTIFKMIFQSDDNSSTGQLIFAISYSFLLAKNFSESLEYKTVMSQKLTEINNQLDELVFQRTKALTTSNEKIEQQNLELEKINQDLQKLSLKDPLTGLWNRRKYDQTIAMEWARCLKSQNPISLLFVDVDYFKNYNDFYGHIVGDECLITIANTLKTTFLRSSDMVVRYGGEEFIVLLSETDKNDAIKMANKLRKIVEELAIPHEASSVKNCVTVSIGVSHTIPDASSTSKYLVAIADKALYYAKTSGRNQVRYLDA